MNQDEGYLLDNRQTEAGIRFEALSALFDPSTFRHFERLGVSEGWRCWEVGAGGPRVPNWLAEHVGSSGRVLATDIDVSWMESTRSTDSTDSTGPTDSPRHATGPTDPDSPRQATGTPVDTTVEVLRHDVGVDQPPPGPFDLIHARLVLVHVKDRDAALRAMIGALRPGGHILIEDAAPNLQPLLCIDEYGPDQALANRLRQGFRELMRGRGADLDYGRKLPRLLREAGLAEVGADAYFPVTSPQCDVLEAATVRHVRDLLLSEGIATAAEIDRHLDNVEAGKLDCGTSPMVSAWGRRPERAAG
jgi:SAM-dependent methyltransferase